MLVKPDRLTGHLIREAVQFAHLVKQRLELLLVDQATLLPPARRPSRAHHSDARSTMPRGGRALCARDDLAHLGTVDRGALGDHAADPVGHGPSCLFGLEYDQRLPVALVFGPRPVAGDEAWRLRNPRAQPAR